MIVGNPACRGAPHASLAREGYQCAELDDPYSAMAELCRRPLVYRALVISLNSFFAEELSLIGAVKRRFPHIEIWLTDLEGRQAALAEALGMGADGLVAEDGLHRIATPRHPSLRVHQPPPQPQTELKEANKPKIKNEANLGGVMSDERRAMSEGESRIEANLRNEATLRNEPNPDTANDDPLACPMGEPILTAEELRALLQDQP